MKKSILIPANLGALASSNAFAGLPARGSTWAFSYAGFIDCANQAPENMQTVNAEMKGLADNELNESKAFQDLTKRATSMNPQEEQAYLFGLAEIDTDEDIAEFVGSDKVPQKHIDALVKNSGMTPADAELALRKISFALMGSQKM